MSIALYTDLPVDDCLRRLSASGWTGAAKPRRWQPTATDPNLLRLVKGRTFQLWPRSWKFVQGYQSPFPQYFHGRLQPHGRGTLVRGYYGASRHTKIGLTLGSFLGFLVLASLDNRYDLRGNGTAPWPSLLIVVTVVSALVFGLYWALDWWGRSQAAECEAYFVDFLARALAARPLDRRQDIAPGETPVEPAPPDGQVPRRPGPGPRRRPRGAP